MTNSRKWHSIKDVPNHVLILENSVNYQEESDAGGKRKVASYNQELLREMSHGVTSSEDSSIPHGDHHKMIFQSKNIQTHNVRNELTRHVRCAEHGHDDSEVSWVTDDGEQGMLQQEERCHAVDPVERR